MASAPAAAAVPIPAGRALPSILQLPELLFAPVCLQGAPATLLSSLHDRQRSVSEAFVVQEPLTASAETKKKKVDLPKLNFHLKRNTWCSRAFPGCERKRRLIYSILAGLHHTIAIWYQAFSSRRKTHCKT